MKKALIIAALLATTLSAHAGFFNGNQLLDKMRSSDKRDNWYALGIVAGIHDANDGSVFCTPRDVTLGQVYDLTMEALVRYPELRNADAAVVMSAALRIKWPCKRGEDI